VIESVVMKIKKGLVGVVGFILSPLSWWNDMLVNFPLSYVFALPFGLIDKHLFLPMFIAGYWATNVLGLVMMHVGIDGVLKKSKVSTNDLKKTIILSIIYSAVIGMLVIKGIIKMPEWLTGTEF